MGMHIVWQVTPVSVIMKDMMQRTGHFDRITVITFQNETSD